MIIDIIFSHSLNCLLTMICLCFMAGHEMAFITFMCCIFKIGALSQADLPAIVLRIFYRWVSVYNYVMHLFYNDVIQLQIISIFEYRIQNIEYRLPMSI